MKLTQSNIRSCPQRWRLASVLSCSRAREGVVSRAMSRRVRAILVASMTSAGFGLLLNAAAAEPEGTVWAKYNNTIHSPTNTISTDGRIPLGTSGTGDAGGTLWQAVIVDVTYKMWYGGSGAGNYRIYHATSPDGLTWTKYTNAIPANSDTNSTDGRIPLGTAGKGDNAGIIVPAVIKDGATYKMWYSGSDGTYWRIYYATSPDGLTWTKYNNVAPTNSDTTSTDGRIPRGLTGGDVTYAGYSAVIKDGDTYKMWYSGYNGTNYRIYYATSPDGLDWTKYDNSIPAPSDTTSTNGRIPLGTSGRGDDRYVYAPAVIKDGNTYKMWYLGDDGAISRIYYATSPDGLTWTKYTNAIPANSDTTSTGGRIPLGATGGDATYVGFPTVIKVGYTYYTWYGGYSGAWRIYHARILPPAGTIFSFH